jgi:hypothetical protein
MKNLESLGRKLSKIEQKKIRGGLEDENILCKTSSVECSFMSPDGSMHTGHCGDKTIANGPMWPAKCGCKYDGVVMEDPGCNSTL